MSSGIPFTVVCTQICLAKRLTSQATFLLLLTNPLLLGESLGLGLDRRYFLRVQQPIVLHLIQRSIRSSYRIAPSSRTRDGPRDRGACAHQRLLVVVPLARIPERISGIVNEGSEISRRRFTD